MSEMSQVVKVSRWKWHIDAAGSLKGRPYLCEGQGHSLDEFEQPAVIAMAPSAKADVPRNPAATRNSVRDVSGTK